MLDNTLACTVLVTLASRDDGAENAAMVFELFTNDAAVAPFISVAIDSTIDAMESFMLV